MSTSTTTTIAINGASGQLGGSTLSALLAYDLAPAHTIVALTHSRPGSSTWEGLAAKGVQVRHANFEDPASYDAALQGVDKLFLVSTPHIQLDFDDGKPGSQPPPNGHGREKHHRAALDAAARAKVPYVYYSSLAYGWDAAAGKPGTSSHAGVMRAHLRTEAYLKQRASEGAFKGAAVVREGLYAETWPTYLGYLDQVDPGADDRNVVRVAGGVDGKVAWTTVADLGIATALLLVAPPEEYAGRTTYLSSGPERARSLREVAALAGRARGRDIGLEVVPRPEFERYYSEGRNAERPSPGWKGGPAVRWWAGAYEALDHGEAAVDDPTLERLLRSVGVTPTSIEEIVLAMVRKEYVPKKIV
ncbi:NAD(P)-binding protein [Hypoxylon sp. NC1633]|nr:NAD(P)-binding protein [Hypoxylon sp. NC1633]